jgi:hypothetical protein
MRTSRFLGCAALVCASAWLRAQDPGATGFAVFDVADLVRGGTAPSLAPVIPPLAAALDGRELLEEGNEREIEVIDPELLAALLRSGVEDLKIEIGPERLWAFGPAASLTAAEKRLADLRAAFGETALVRVAAVKRAPGKAVLSAAEAAAFFAAETPTFSAAATGRTDRAFVLRAGRDLSFVADYTVEVAQKASIANPTVARLSLGLSAVVAAYAMPDGRLLVRVGGVYAALAGEPRNYPAGDPSRFGDVQCPEVTTSGVSGGAVIESGGAFVVGGGRQGGAWIVQATRSAPSGGDTVGLAALLRPRTSLAGLKDSAAGDPSTRILREEGFDGRAPLDGDRLLTLLRSRAGAGVADSLTLVQGGRLFVPGGGETRAALGRFASELAERLLRNSSCELRYGVVDAATAERMMRGEIEASAVPAGKLLATSPAGERFRLLACDERSYVASTECEIAQECSIADPQVRSALRGICFEGVLDRASDGAISLKGRFTRRDEQGGFVVGPRLPNGATIEAPSGDVVEMSGSSTLSTSGYALFAAAAAPGGVFVVLARATE